MSTITYIPARHLQPGDTIKFDASIVSVDTVEPDEFDPDEFVWLWLTCRSGNFDQFEQPRRFDADHDLAVLDAKPRDAHLTDV